MHRLFILVRTIFILFLLGSTSLASAADVRGRLAKWHPIEIDFRGPLAAETDNSPNPFLDYRLSVELTSPSGRATTVPGFFAGDGQGSGRGNTWRVRFSADETGQWTYNASFRAGSNVAINLDAQAGSSAALEGATGSFSVEAAPADAPEFLRHGRLEYVGAHYLKFRDGPYWIKGGTDSPENILGFAGIDGTFDQGGIDANFLHEFSAHRNDWRENDPLFSHASTGADSRGLIGALNYLGAQGVNSIYFLPMNLGGDGQETYPFVGAENNRFNKTHYDISKLHQWNQVLNHAQEQGVALNIVLSETEEANERWLDNGALGDERKLFFRELVARFGYLLAVKWNLGEENDFPRVELDKHSDYLQAIDWSGKPIAVHTHINQFFRYGEIVGDPRYEATSIQYDPEFAGQFVEQWRNNSANTGHPWVIDMDENTDGLAPTDVDQRRKQIMYDVFFSGGNLEWYFGFHPLPLGSDVTAGDFRLREVMWQQMRLAREMMQSQLPFWRMQPADNLVDNDSDAFGGAEVFALTNEAYAIYLPSSNGNEVLNLRDASGRFAQRWFNPRTGEYTNGNTNFTGSSSHRLGSPPSQQGEDWVVLVTRTDQSTVEPPPQTSAEAPRFQSVPNPTVSVGEQFAITLSATDSDGTFPSVTVGQLPPGMRINGLGNGQLELSWSVPATASNPSVVELIAIDATDGSLRTTQTMSINVNGAGNGAANDGANDDSNDDGQQPDNGAVISPPEQTSAEAPRFQSVPNPTVSVGEQFAITLSATDSDGTFPSVTVGQLPPGMRINGPGNGQLELTWSVPATASNPSVVELIAIDATDGSLRTTQTMTINVNGAGNGAGNDGANNDSNNGANDGSNNGGQQPDNGATFSPPVFRAVPRLTISANQRLSQRIVADDADGIPPALNVINAPEGSSLDDNGDGTRSFNWQPTLDDVGTRTITFIARDSAQPSLNGTLEIEIQITP